MKALIEEKSRLNWSSDQIYGLLTRENKPRISYQTIYKHICADKRCGGLLFQHLRRKEKRIPLVIKISKRVEALLKTV
jgi:IS30 family transposase